MGLPALPYIAANTPVHRCDARAKIALLLAVSIAVMSVATWWGMALLAAVVLGCSALARIPIARLAAAALPVAFLAAFSWAMHVMSDPGWGGFALGAFFAARMVLLALASFVVCFSTTSEQLLEAFRGLAAPLRALGVPVDDIAFTLALSVRFIPVVGQEFCQVRAAQAARGGEVANVGPVRALRVWGAAFASVFVGMFRRADRLATAMDARCYGAAPVRTQLDEAAMSPAGAVATVAACAVLVAVGVLL